MIFYKNRKKNKDWLKPFSLLLVVLILLIFGNFFIKALFPSVILIAKPVSCISEVASESWFNFFQFFRSRRSLVEEKESLKKENADLKLALVIRRELEKENNELKRLLGLVSNSKKRPFVAKVILMPNLVSRGTIILDIGSYNLGNKIKIGDLVVYDDKVLLGKIVEVKERQAKVRLISAGDTIPVLIGNKKIPAEVKGLGSGNFLITLPKAVKVYKGDSIVVPEYGGYLLGLVDVIEKTTADPFQTILFNSPVNIFQIKWVEIYGS